MQNEVKKFYGGPMLRGIRCNCRQWGRNHKFLNMKLSLRGVQRTHQNLKVLDYYKGKQKVEKKNYSLTTDTDVCVHVCICL